MKTRVRAVIIKDGKILLIKRIKADITYWVIPGGAVEKNETNEQALIRESKEELGIDVAIKDLLLKIDSEKPETKGQVELFYLCEIIGGRMGSGKGPEFQKDSGYAGQYGTEWIKIENLKKIDLKPKDISNLIFNKHNQRQDG
jgi:mutator protein MutT